MTFKLYPPKGNGNRWRLVSDPGVASSVAGVIEGKDGLYGSVDAMAVMARRMGEDGVPVPADYYVAVNAHPPAIASLRGYQVDGVSRLVGNLQRDGGAILADDMGLGKTVQTIAIWNSLRRPIPLLVICPASVRGTWVREIRKWTDIEPVLVETGEQAKNVDRDAKVVITSYELSKKLGPQFTPHKIVLDEAHLLRGRTATRSQHLLELAKTATYRLALTGTPMWSRPRDFWMLLKILFGYRFGTADQFDEAYCGMYRNSYGGKENKGATRLDELKLRLQYVMLRRTKEQVSAELPELTRQIRWVPCTKEAKRATEAAATRQMHFTEALKFTLEAKMPAAIEAAESAGRFLLFTWQKAHAEQMYQKLLDDGFEVELLTGDYSHSEREAAIARAKLKGASLVATIDSSNAGIDGMQEVADTVIFHHLDYVPIKMAQAEARLHRIGQKNPVTVIYIAMQDSIDQFIIETVVDKLDAWRNSMGTDSTSAMNDTLSKSVAMNEAEALKALYAAMGEE